MADGLNIATKAGEGSAGIFHWEGLHNTINNLIQRDIKRQDELKQEYQKSSLMAAQAMQGLRPADIEPFKEDYNNFKKASIMLTNPNIQRDTKAFQYWTDQKMSSYANMLQRQAESKEMAKNLYSIVEENTKSNGLNQREDFSQRMSEANQLPTRELIKQGRNLPTYYLYDKGQITKGKFDDLVLGTEKNKREVSTKVGNEMQTLEYNYPKTVEMKFDASGKPMISSITGNPILNYDEMARKYHSHITELGGADRARMKNEFNIDAQNDPQKVKDTFARANALLKESGSGEQLSILPEYYELSQAINKASDQVTKSLKKTDLTPEEKRTQRLSDYQAKQDIAFGYRKMFKEMFPSMGSDASENLATSMADEIAQNDPEAIGKQRNYTNINGKNYSVIPINNPKVMSTFKKDVTVYDKNYRPEKKKISADEVRFIPDLQKYELIWYKRNESNEKQRDSKNHLILEEQELISPEQYGNTWAGGDPTKKGVLGLKGSLKKVFGDKGKKAILD